MSPMISKFVHSQGHPTFYFEVDRQVCPVRWRRQYQCRSSARPCHFSGLTTLKILKFNAAQNHRDIVLKKRWSLNNYFNALNCRTSKYQSFQSLHNTMYIEFIKLFHCKRSKAQSRSPRSPSRPPRTRSRSLRPLPLPCPPPFPPALPGASTRARTALPPRLPHPPKPRTLQ